MERAARQEDGSGRPWAGSGGARRVIHGCCSKRLRCTPPEPSSLPGGPPSHCLFADCWPLVRQAALEVHEANLEAVLQVLLPGRPSLRMSCLCGDCAA